jgi:hypothetical protein
MLELFLNPWAMIAGVLCISVPIIIHLINRLRYRRVRWAAMEFLLKAQKRMKKKLILQQLLLLLLRIVMVLLLGLLLGRYLGFDLSGQEKRTTLHVLLLDDTPSMTDGWDNDAGQPTDSFEAAKKFAVEQIAGNISQATTPQLLEVIRLSDLGTSRAIGRVNAKSTEELASYLNGLKASTVRTPLHQGLARVNELFANQPPEVGKVVHVLSDFRQPDWTEETDRAKSLITELTAGQAKVYLVDVAHPYRKKDEKGSPLAHDNIAITELSSSKPVVARNDPVEFTLRAKNFGSSELRDVRFEIKVNGLDDKGRSVLFSSLPAGQERSLKFELTLDRVGSETNPLDRFSLITANLASGEPGRMSLDNVRHTVVEVRDRLPILVIEGRPQLRDSREGDAFYLRPVFSTVIAGYALTNGTQRDLEQSDLSKYAFILLANVGTISELAVKRLEEYCQQGGGVGFFLGPDVNSKDYNTRLYREGQGIFPVPLTEQPSKPLTEEEILTRSFRINQKKFLVRDPSRRSHPALAGLYLDERGETDRDSEKLERVFGFVTIKQYWPVPRLGKWRDDKSVTELYCMPNDQPMADYEAAIRKVADALPVEDPAYAKYRELLTKARTDLRRLAISSEALYRLGSVLDELLADQIGSGDPTEALLREFWANPKLADLKSETSRLRDIVKFGDPFYLAKDFGRGRVVTLTTTAGEAWTNWPSESPANASYTPIMKLMGNYLAGGGADVNRFVGETLTESFDQNRVRPVVKRNFMTWETNLSPAAGEPAALVKLQDLREQTLVPQEGKLVLNFNETAAPGAYLLTYASLKTSPDGSSSTELPDYKAYAFNVDGAKEGDLRRASRDDILLNAPGALFHTAGDSDWAKDLQNKKSDLSEWIWLFLTLFVLLLGELLMSVWMSYQSSPGDSESLAPSTRTLPGSLSSSASATTPATAA